MINGELTVKLEAKTYLLDSFNADGFRQLNLVDYGDRDFSVNIVGAEPENEGELRTTLTTKKSKGSIIGGIGAWVNSNIQKIIFENKSEFATNYKAALEIMPTNTNGRPKNWNIKNNEFRNFTRTIYTGGYDTMNIENNQFLQINGNRTAENYEHTERPDVVGPNVGIWSVPEVRSQNLSIVGNNYNGCVGVTVDSSRKIQDLCGDGLVFGAANKIVVRQNRIIDFSYEGIYLFPIKPSDGSTLPTSIVEGNTLIGTTLRHGGRYGIRVDLDHTIVRINSISKVSSGFVASAGTYDEGSRYGSGFFNQEFIEYLEVYDNTINVVRNDNGGDGNGQTRYGFGFQLHGVAHSSFIHNAITLTKTSSETQMYGIFANGNSDRNLSEKGRSLHKLEFGSNFVSMEGDYYLNSTGIFLQYTDDSIVFESSDFTGNEFSGFENSYYTNSIPASVVQSLKSRNNFTNEIPGCMNDTDRYIDPSATVDDGQCFSSANPDDYNFEGYNAADDQATGCTDSSASNFNEEAMVDDGLCYYD